MVDTPHTLDAETVDRVLRRASELSATAAATDPHLHLTEALVLEAATEAGIDPDAVKLSLAIERVGPVPQANTLDSVAGPSVLAVDRLLALDADTVLGRFDELLVRRHGLRRSRERSDRGEWRRRNDAFGSIQRAANKFGGDGPTLAYLERIEVHTSTVDQQRTLVRVLVSRRPQRTIALAGGVSLGAAGVVAAAGAAVVATPLAVVGVPIAASGLVVARRGRRQASELTDDLERMIDLVERGSKPVSLSADLKRMLRTLRS
jgi:hypothetical protein